MTSQRLNSRRPMLLGLMLVVLVGCGSDESKYIPSETQAREALTAALTAWKSGQAHGPVKTFAVPIDTFDARWQAGQKLAAFEVLNEVASEGPKTFVVKMKLVGEAVEQDVIYLVVGNDPLLIFRQQDYEKASGMGGG